MTDDTILSLAGFLLTSLGAVLLYLSCEHQRLMSRRPPARPLLLSGAVALTAGTAAWIAAWSGLVGGLLALAVWMTVSLALPYLLARRSI